MAKSLTPLVVYTLVVTQSFIYATQPLQPLLAQEFGVSMAHASYFTAVVLFCMAVAPIIYGYILEGTSAKKMLAVSLAVVFVANIALALSQDAHTFLVLRLVQGLCAPAILTAAMSILARSENLKFSMSLYVAGTVFGGLSGRIFGGLIASAFSWRLVFVSLGVGALVAAVLVLRSSFAYEAKLAKGSLADVAKILATKDLRWIYALMFIMFFVFAGVLNVLPFRMKELFGNISEARIGALYMGFGSGIVVSLLAPKIVRLFKTEANAILAGGAVFTLAVALFSSSDELLLFALMFVACVGMFAVHSIASAFANSVYREKKALASGMYLTFYYIGGTLGSILPSYFYQFYGWDLMIAGFVAVLVIFYSLFFIKERYARKGV